MNYTAKDIEEFFEKYNAYATHAVIAHTKIHTFGKSDRAINMAAAQAKRDLRHALNVFNKCLYPKHTSLPKRKPFLYRPLCFVTIEGAKQTTDPAQTIHFNITLGNIPKQFSTTMLEIIFRYAWHVRAGQSNDLYFDALSEYAGDSRMWHGYILKEARQDTNKAWSTDGTWDVENSWIPHQAIAAD
jgi:hypothetical protein